MARKVRKPRVREVPLSEIKDDLSRFLREAESREIVITRHGKPAGVLIGFGVRGMLGSSTGSKTIRAFSSGSRRPARVCALGAGCVLKMLTSERSNRSLNSDAKTRRRSSAVRSAPVSFVR